ncbi:uncharacterized protein LACBIDRAFT_308234 [Laccaria bicolor S238N-H82]|uniref:Predicted protein n=1 Tax=Laccaria bicolor (strain S238N-H82 / ATCC MYA-4686) TaxID=486041 RepID=B0DRW3_LACBS|nr:uncharacterized protein LACBIDRAFT_308234 [Laccaria bicolor S238N-H82]EDR02595.1 predicted protein [Laccaria bicolor S238N-H82]|eukprot:XP_001886639.1 predicted protein [Laccaria bicolor S238N-H82]
MSQDEPPAPLLYECALKFLHSSNIDCPLCTFNLYAGNAAIGLETITLPLRTSLSGHKSRVQPHARLHCSQYGRTTLKPSSIRHARKEATCEAPVFRGSRETVDTISIIIQMRYFLPVFLPLFTCFRRLFAKGLSPL